uniref:Uncharacterized protein n=1 Tax=Glossina palpalis gambiensis TaxID=67801 RepID=A0A1B0BBR8_9MUSC
MALSRSYAGFAAVSADAVDILKRICHFECCSSMYDYGVRILCKVDDCYLLNATTSYNAIIINRCRHLGYASQHNLKAGLLASINCCEKKGTIYISFPNAGVFKLFNSSFLLYAVLLWALQPETRINWLQCKELAMFVPFDDFLVGIARLWRVSIAHKEKENGGQGNFQQLVTTALTSEEFYLEVMSRLVLTNILASHTIEVKIDFYMHVTCLHKRGVVDTDFKS